MALAIGGALVALCLVVAGLPFLRKRVAAPEAVDPILELQRRREAIYQEVRTLHSDYELGVVPQAEYEERLQSYRLQAAKLLQEQERLEELDRRLEEEIVRLRDSGNASVHQMRCPECGRPMGQGAEQCPFCGTVPSEVTPDS